MILASILVILCLILLVLMVIAGLIYTKFPKIDEKPPETAPEVHFPAFLAEKVEKSPEKPKIDEKLAELDEIDQIWPNKSPWRTI